MGAIHFLAPQLVKLHSSRQKVRSNVALTATGSEVYKGFGLPVITVQLNVTGAVTGTTPSLVLTLEELDPGDLSTVLQSVSADAANSALDQRTLKLALRYGDAVRVSWTITGTTPSFGGTYITLTAGPGSAPAVDGLGIGTITNVADAIVVPLEGKRGAGALIDEGLFVGTLQAQITIDGINWIAVPFHELVTNTTATSLGCFGGSVQSNLQIVVPAGAKSVRIVAVDVPSPGPSTQSIALRATEALGSPDVHIASWLGSAAPTPGQKTMFASLPVVLASNQTPDAIARAWFNKLTDGTNTAAVKAASTAPVATDPALVVTLSPNSDITVTNATFGALFSAVTLSTLGRAYVSCRIAAGITATVQAEASFDGTTFQETYFYNPVVNSAASHGLSPRILLTGAAVQRGIIVPAGAVAVQIRITAATSGTASATLINTDSGHSAPVLGPDISDTAVAAGGSTWAVTVQPNGRPYVVFNATAGLTGSNTARVQYSMDGGLTTFSTSSEQVYDPATGTLVTATIPFAGAALTRVIRVPPGATHVRVSSNVSSGGSSSTVTLRAISNGSPFPLIPGQQTAANSKSTVLASDQVPNVISQSWFTKNTDGTNTAAVKAASTAAAAADPALVVSLSPNSPLSIAAGNNNIGDVDLATWVGGSTAPTVGQKAMSSSIPVVIANDQPGGGDIAARAQFTKVTDGTNTAAVKAASTAAVAADPALVVQLSPNLGAIGQKAMAASLPVTMASDQVSTDVLASGTFTALNDTLTINMGGKQSIGFMLQQGSSLIGSLISEATVNGSTYSFASVFVDPSGNQSQLINCTAAGGTQYYQIRAVPGCQSIRVRLTNYTSGGGTGWLRASDHLAVIDATITGWFGSPAPTVGLKTVANSIPVGLPSDQIPNILAQSWFNKLTDGTNTAAVKAASTAPAATDPALVVALSQNTPGVKVWDGTNVMPAGDVAARAQFHKLTDGTNTAAVKAASTAPVATDPALVVALSQNTPGVKVWDGTNVMPTADVAARAQFTKTTDGTNVAAVKAASTAPVATDPALVVTVSQNTPGIKIWDGTNTLPTADVAARAQFTKTTDGTNTAAVKAASTAAVAADPALVTAPSPNSAGPTYLTTPNELASGIFATNFPAGYLRTSDEPRQILYEPFEGVALDTQQWNAAVSAGGGVAAAVASGNLTLGTGTTISGYSVLQSNTSIRLSVPAWVGFSSAISVENPVTANTFRFWGQGTVPGSPTAALPVTNGVGFEMTTAGKLFAVVYSNGTRTAVQDLSAATGNSKQPTDALFHRYVIYVRTDRIFWYIDSLDIPVATSNFQSPQVQTLPVLFLAVAGSSAPASSGVITVAGTAVWDTGKNASSISDGTYGFRKATVKAASTAPVAADPALVVSVSPNSTVPNRVAPASTPGLANVAASVTSVQLLAANTNRLRAYIYNDSAAVLTFKYGATASLTSLTEALQPYETWIIDDGYTGRVDGIWSAATGAARCTELTP